jgi:hypothetical protein
MKLAEFSLSCLWKTGGALLEDVNIGILVFCVCLNTVVGPVLTFSGVKTDEAVGS